MDFNSSKEYTLNYSLFENQESGLVDATKLAEYLGVSVSWVYQKTKDREIPFIRVGKFIRYSFDEVLEHLKAKTNPKKKRKKAGRDPTNTEDLWHL